MSKFCSNSNYATAQDVVQDICMDQDMGNVKENAGELGSFIKQFG
jgi:hypothetical protein